MDLPDLALAIAAAATLTVASAPLQAQEATPAPTPTQTVPARDARKDYNVDKEGVAIEGYDPVAYFDGAPAKGDKSITATHNGVTYRFASAANRAKFEASPDKYVPAYGGWCAYAMVEGDKVEVDPETFKIVDGRLFLYYNGLLGNTLKRWNKGNEGEQVRRADANWEKASGEKAPARKDGAK